MKTNHEDLPIMERIIASAVVVSRDGKVLMGRKDPKGGGVYADAWHIPGGGMRADETLEDAMRRELVEEAPGINLEKATIERLDNVGKGETIKVVGDVKYWCRTEFNRFKVSIPEDAETLSRKVRPGDDLVRLRWFSPEELGKIEHIPGGREFFQEIGLIR